MPENCFIGGTLMHPPEGLRPIEEIKLGDYVLSKPEDGSGEPRYKRVTQTFRSENKEVWSVDFVKKSVQEEAWRSKRSYDQKHIFRLVATPNHTFWVRGHGWLRVDKFFDTVFSDGLPEFELADGDVAVLSHIAPISKRAGNSDHGWCSLLPHEDGFTIDLSQGGKSAESCVYIQNNAGEIVDCNDFSDWTDPENVYRCTVYNLEVEDDHTYFVGTKGVFDYTELPELSHCRSLASRRKPGTAGFIRPAVGSRRQEEFISVSPRRRTRVSHRLA